MMGSEKGLGIITKRQILEMDARDSLSKFRDDFELPKGVFLDGNSLGCLPKATLPRIKQVVEEQWGQDLISSWNKHSWITLPQRIGADLARLLGAQSNEVLVADSTSVNIFKTVSAALDLRPDRQVIISERSNFPTDLYIVDGLIKTRGNKQRLKFIDTPEDLSSRRMDLQDVAVVLLTHVSYCTGRMLDMARITSAVQKGGALIVWDLAHSAGAVPVNLNECNADFAVGCGYKYLNGGPGAPAFLYVAQRHQEKARNPLSGWMGHKDMFAFEDKYRPADGEHAIDRFMCGTSSIIACVALQVGVELMLTAEQKQLRSKSVALGVLFQQLISQECHAFGFVLHSPSRPEDRGSQINYRHGEGYSIIQALIARGVTGDFRSPDILRFGFTPLYTTFLDVWEAVQHLRLVMELREWDREEYKRRSKVT